MVELTRLDVMLHVHCLSCCDLSPNLSVPHIIASNSRMIDGEFEQKWMWPYQGASSVDALTKIRNDYHPNTNQNCNHLGQCSRSYAA